MLGNQKSFGKRSLFILEDWRQQNVTFSYRTGFLPCLSTYLATLICVPTWMIILYCEVHFNWSQLTLLKNLPLEYELLQQNVWVREVYKMMYFKVHLSFQWDLRETWGRVMKLFETLWPSFYSCNKNVIDKHKLYQHLELLLATLASCPSLHGLLGSRLLSVPFLYVPVL